MPDVFLSYNREDAATARRFAEAFEREGFKVWWDATLRSGEAYDQVTEKALKEAKAVVVLWSKKSVDSRWVRAEATLADRNRTLVPAMIEACDRPIMFELTQTADLSHWTGEASDRTWQTFLADVRRFVDRGESKPSTAQAPLATSSSAPEGGGEPGLVVLPIASRSGLPEDDAFAADMTSEITSEAAQSRFVNVIARGAIAAHGGTADDLRAIARELGARYAVETHIRRIGTDLRLMVQLVDADTGNILWSQKYDRPLDRVAALQDELAIEVASHIGVAVLRVELARATQKSGDWSAWERAVRAMASMGHMGSESLSVAVDEARQALLIAPDYALAHSMLAGALAASWNWGDGSDPSAVAEVRAHIKRAVDLDDGNDPRILRNLALASMAVGDAQAALRFAERAMEVNPHHPHSHAALGYAYVSLGRATEAIAAFDAQERLAPHDGLRYLAQYFRAMAHLMAERPAEAEAALDRSLKLNPNFMMALRWKAIVATMLGHQDEARLAVRALRETEPLFTLERHVTNILRFMSDPRAAAVASAALRRAWAEADPSA